MDRLESMRMLVAVATAGSFSAAARRLRAPLATVSRKVSMLEDELGVRLLQRTTRRLTPTPSGSTYIAACRRILDEVEEAERAAVGEHGMPKGVLVIAAPIVFGRLHVLPLAGEFLQRFPDVDVRLALSDRVSNLFEREADIAVRVGELSDSSLIATRVGAVSRVVCGSPSYFARRKVPRRPEDLSRHECITFDALSAADRWTFRGGKADKSVRVRSRLIVSTAEAALDAAAQGLGVTRVLSYQMAQAERTGSLVRVLRAFEPAATPVHLVHLGLSPLPARIRAFLDFAASALKARLAES